MARHKETYLGCAIEIEDDTTLTIDGKDIDCEHGGTGNKWVSRYLPYSEYDSLLDLAKAIVHHTAEFRGDKE